MKNKRILCILTVCAAFALSSCGSRNEATADFAPIGEGAGGALAEGGAYEYPSDYDTAAPSETYAAATAAPSETYAAADEYGEIKMEDSYSLEGSFAINGEDHQIITVEPEISPQHGLLTSGEWNDNKNFDFWTNLISQREDWSEMPQRWNLNTQGRVAVTVTDGGEPAENVTLKLFSGNTLIWQAVSDNNGNAYLFKTLSNDSQYKPTRIVAEQGGKFLSEMEYTDADEVQIEVQSMKYGGDILDLMFVIDTTGSMGDELAYLQAELNDIIDRVASENQIPVRLSVNFYRDTDDEYVVNAYDFTTNISTAVRNLNQQNASGGGDYEEAVETALEEGINSAWQEGNTKLMFLILDAPPHYNDENAEKLASVLSYAASQGIRIIPVASSGVDTETEFLCRTFAIATGGTYTFLTDHSGIGGDHLEPTVGYYQVEKLNDMIVRIINSYL